jgi:RimJ/RimL family protein N-acetyltransferase
MDGGALHTAWPSRIPELVTERRRLRAPRRRDAAALRRAARDTPRWAIELVEHREVIGTVGLPRFDHEHRHAELGHETARRRWGQGLTPEAAAAVIRYGFSVLGLHRIEAGALPGNDASVR